MSLLLINGDALEIPLADSSVQMCVTSPPYWGLRKYSGNMARVWGGEKNCPHDWGDDIRPAKYNWEDKIADTSWDGGKQQSRATSYSAFCLLCNAWRGELGLEPTPELYCANMVAIFKEVKRVLRSDGTVWLNMGDSYAGGGGAHTLDHANPGLSKSAYRDGVPHYSKDGGRGVSKLGDSLKPKDLVGIPWAVAFALRADGWWLRSDIIYSKVNPMPESVTDRCTKSHEYIFMLTKSKTYFYDQDAIREPVKPASLEREKYGWNAAFVGRHTMPGENRPHSDDHDGFTNPAGRNKRTVWNIATAPYSGSHFSTYPPALVEPCIKAGTSERGCCPECGSPWERITEKSTRFESGSGKAGRTPDEIGGKWGDKRYGENILLGPVVDTTTLGWRPTCSCCRKCDIIGTSTGGNNYAAQRQRTRISMEKGMESQALDNQRRASGESGHTEKKVSENMQEMPNEVQGTREREVLQSDLLGKVDVGEREGKPIRVSGGRQIYISESKWEDIHGTPLDNGETPRETIRTLGERSSHQRHSIRQSDRESNSIDKSKPCQDPHEKQFGHGLEPHEPVPATVADIFCGSGTTLLVARQLGRHGVGMDLSAEYLQLARERLSLDALEDWEEGKKADKIDLTDLPLFVD